MRGACSVMALDMEMVEADKGGSSLIFAMSYVLCFLLRRWNLSLTNGFAGEETRRGVGIRVARARDIRWALCALMHFSWGKHMEA